MDNEIPNKESCTIVSEIISKGFAKDEQNSIGELKQRKEINEHLSTCKDSKCNQMRIDRINIGLY